MKEIAVIGGTGFVGGHLRSALSDQPLRLIGRGLTRAVLKPRERLVVCDVYDKAQLTAALAGCESVVNLVGVLNESRGASFERVYVDLARCIAEAAHSAGVTRLVQMSALRAGEGESGYLQARGEAESVVRQSGLEWVITRPSVIFGPGDSFLNRFVDLLRMAPVFPLTCPQARMQPVYVGDVSRLLARAARGECGAGQVLELGGPQVYTLREIVSYLNRLTGLNRTLIDMPDAASRLMASLLQFAPGKPFTPDNYASLQTPSTTENNALSHPVAMETVAPRMFSEHVKARRYQAYRTRHR